MLPQDPPPPAAVVALFDPALARQFPVVPTPSDLATDATTGKIVAGSVPSSDATPAARKELNQDYLGKVTGFPFESTAGVLLSGPLDAATVTADTVIVLDLTAQATPVANVTRRDDDTKRSIAIAPPPGGWTHAHQYAIALIGGAGKNALRGRAAEDVIGSPAWVLLSGRIPLIECATTDPNDCRPTVDIIPSDAFVPRRSSPA